MTVALDPRLLQGLPAADLRSNLATWSVPGRLVPAVAAALQALPREEYDPGFLGQELETTYFDTPGLALRKARRKKKRYLTFRVRCYRPADPARDGAEEYALSAKTEAQKFRIVIPSGLAEALLRQGLPAERRGLLPADLHARLLELTGGEKLVPVVTVCARRYAGEDDVVRLTLDVDVATDAGKRLPFHVLEFKAQGPDTPVPAALAGLGLRPVKLSKFLWSTNWGGR
jgi:hypothetical protein